MTIIGILTSGVLGDCDQGFGSLVDVLRLYVHTYEFNIIVKAHNTSTLSSFDVLFADVAGLIVEEPMWIATPGDTPHVHSTSRIG